MITKDTKASTARLERMRNSQRRLRDQRKKELDTIKQENQRLLSENQALVGKIDKLRDDFNALVELFDFEITGKQLEKLQIVSGLGIRSGDTETVDLDEFISTYDLGSEHLLLEGKFLLWDVCNKQLRCFNNVISSSRTASLSTSTFRYLKLYGIQLIAKFVRELQNVIYDNKIPKSWVEGKAPFKGSLGLVDILRYYLKNADLNAVHLDVFSSFLAKYSFATDNGIAIFQHDLNRSIQYSTTLQFDAAYLLGYIDDDICERTYRRGKVPCMDEQGRNSISLSDASSGPNSTTSTDPTSNSTP